MCEIIDFNSRRQNKIIGKRYGTVVVSVYKAQGIDLSMFLIKPENEEVAKVAEAIEEALKLY